MMPFPILSIYYLWLHQLKMRYRLPFSLALGIVSLSPEFSTRPTPSPSVRTNSFAVPLLLRIHTHTHTHCALLLLYLLIPDFLPLTLSFLIMYIVGSR